MEKQEGSKVSYGELKAAFQHFYSKVKEYFEKRGSSEELGYLDICEYISGHLSNKGDVIDLEWYRNERDMGGFSKEVNGRVYAYCQDKVLKEGQYFIPDDEPLLSP